MKHEQTLGQWGQRHRSACQGRDLDKICEHTWRSSVSQAIGGSGICVRETQRHDMSNASVRVYKFTRRSRCALEHSHTHTRCAAPCTIKETAVTVTVVRAREWQCRMPTVPQGGGRRRQLLFCHFMPFVSDRNAVIATG